MLTQGPAMRIEVIESEEKIAALLPWIYEMAPDSLIEAQDTEVIKRASRRDEQEQTRAPPSRSMRWWMKD